MARRYRPALPPTIRALAAMLCAGLGMSLLLSVAWPKLGSLGDILILGTLARALLIGMALTWVISRTGFAHSRLAAAIAVLATTLAIVGAHYQAHREWRAERVSSAEDQWLSSAGSGRDRAEVDAELADNLATLTFANYLRGYFGLESPAGSLEPDAATSKTGPAFGIGLYAFELLVALLAATYFPAGRASEPVCPSCGRWLEENEPSKAAHGIGSEFLSLMQGGRHREATELLEPPDTDEFVSISLSRCPAHCEDSWNVLRLRESSRQRGSRELSCRHLADLIVTREELTELEAWT